MTERVPSDQIEGIMGISRHESLHFARAISDEQMVYILHSRECLNSGVDDLRDCPFSLALDNGIDVERWPEDVSIEVAIENGALVPSPSVPEEG